MNTLWIIIWRLQPPTVGHTTLIDTALRDNDLVLVLLWGNGEVDDKNPLSFEQRDELLQLQYVNQDLLIDYLLDKNSDEAWVDSISGKINTFGLYDQVTFYAGDLENDSAILALQKYESNLFIDNVCYHEIARSNVTTMYDWAQTPISATLVRKAVWEWKFEDIKRAIPKNIRKEIKALFS